MVELRFFDGTSSGLLQQKKQAGKGRFVKPDAACCLFCGGGRGVVVWVMVDRGGKVKER